MLVVRLAALFTLAVGSAACGGTDVDDSEHEVATSTGGSLAPDGVRTISGVSMLSASVRSTCAVHDDGRVSCWGAADLPEAEPRRVPEWVDSVDNAVAVATTYSGACALLSTGKLSCWGSGRLVNQADPDEPELTPPSVIDGLSDVELVDGYWEHVCAVHDDEKVSCVGWKNPFSYFYDREAHAVELTDLDAVDELSVATESNPELCQLLVRRAASAKCVSAASDEDDMLVWREEPVDVDDVSMLDAPCLVASGDAYCSGGNGPGLLGRPREELRRNQDFVKIPNLGEVTAIATGGSHRCALLEDGTLWCWGANGQGQLGQDERTAHSHIPLQVPLPGEAKQVVVAEHHSCALLDSGEVMCWGDNQAGQIGDGRDDVALIPVWVKPPK